MAISVTRIVGDRGMETSVGDSVVACDLPPTMGGSGRGPTPTDLFIASLGSCVATFVWFYCRRVHLEARGMHVDVHYDQRTAPGRVVGLRVTIVLPNADVTLHRHALLGAAQHCPIGEAIETIGAIEFELEGA